MIIGWGLNTTSTLDPSEDSELSIPSPKDLSLPLRLVDDIVWTSWSCTVGRSKSFSAVVAIRMKRIRAYQAFPSSSLVPDSSTFFIWGFHPSLLHSSNTLPTNLKFPPSLVPKSFVGRESLEAILGEDGVVYVPREEDSEGEDWVPSSSSSDDPLPLFRDVAVLGTGEWLGIHGKHCIHF